MSGSPTILDAAFLAVAIISGLLAMYRGFSREVLSILSWIAAAGAAYYFVTFQKPLAETVSTQLGIGSVQIAQIGIGALVFLVVLILVHYITMRISDVVLDSRIGMVDRSLGLLFGVARAFVLVLIPYMGLAAAVDKKDQHPSWVREAWSMQLIEPASDSLSGFLRQRIESFYARKQDKT
jgi:membrane protein required for colicin V production